MGERLPIPTNAGSQNMTSHMTGFNRKRSGTVKHMNVRDIMDRLEYCNPLIDIEEAGSSG